MFQMYRHVIVPVDCSDDARREAHRVARYLSDKHGTKVTLAAGFAPATDPELRQKKVRHAEAALKGITEIMTQYGIRTRWRILEGDDDAQAFATESRDPDEQYDLFILGVHQTRPEFDEVPCRGSFADRLIQKSPLPVIVLPARV